MMESIDQEKWTSVSQLEMFWNHFLYSRNDELKNTYLELFIHEYYKTEKSQLGEYRFVVNKFVLLFIFYFCLFDYSFLSTVPSQLSLRILQMINATISNDENCVLKEFQHVESLREFLLVGTAGRIVEFLNEIGVEVSSPFSLRLTYTDFDIQSYA